MSKRSREKKENKEEMDVIFVKEKIQTIHDVVTSNSSRPTKRVKRTGWTCERCTFRNDSDMMTRCTMCDTPRRNKEIEKRNQTCLVSVDWPCEMCTFVNDHDATQCRICLRPRPPMTPVEPTPYTFENGGGPVVMSWNIAMGESSYSCPAEWSKKRQFEALTNVVRRHNPDILALQEVPNEEWIRPWKQKLGYVSTTVTASHCGLVMLLIRRPLSRSVISKVSIGPAVVVTLRCAGTFDLCISSMHLFPSKSNAFRRREQLKSIVSWCKSQTTSSRRTYWILCGDTNMRKSEETAVENLASCQETKTPGLLDAWKSIGSLKDTRFTWDSHRNKFHQECFSFTCRFDRIYTHRSDGQLLRPNSFSLVGNTLASSSSGHYLSDHFGLLASFSF